MPEPYSIAHHQRMNPKKVSTFGKKNAPIKQKSARRNPLVFEEFYKFMREKANEVGCDAHHWIPKSKLKQDIFLVHVPYDEHREIHACGNDKGCNVWAMEKGFDVLVNDSMDYFYQWAIDNELHDAYFELISDLRYNPLNAHDIARDFILNNRSL